MLLVVVITIWLAACTTIDPTNKVDGWPTLDTQVHVVDVAVVSQECDKYVPWYEVAVACSVFNFDNNTCDIFLPIGYSKGMRVHEESHCKGYDHPGSTYMKDSFNEWKNTKGK